MAAARRNSAGRVVVALAAAALLATAAACGGGGGGSDGDGAGNTTGGLRGGIPGELVGVVTELQRSGGRITGFTLKTDDGKTHQITLDPAVDYGVTDQAFEAHEQEGNTLSVGIDEREGKLYATVILPA
jgi:hypothetical protein